MEQSIRVAPSIGSESVVDGEWHMGAESPEAPRRTLRSARSFNSSAQSRGSVATKDLARATTRPSDVPRCSALTNVLSAKSFASAATGVVRAADEELPAGIEIAWLLSLNTAVSVPPIGAIRDPLSAANPVPPPPSVCVLYWLRHAS